MFISPNFAILGIENDALNLIANLLVFFLVVVWLSLVYWTYSDAKRRIDDPMLVGCATVAALFPFIGTIVYMIVRPPEFLEDVKERELEIQSTQARVKQLERVSCPNCRYPVESSFLRCPSCMFQLKQPCHNCGKPVDPSWQICPFCESNPSGVSRPTSQPAHRRSGRVTAQQASETSGAPKRSKRKPSTTDG